VKKYLCRMVFALCMAAWASTSMGGAIEYKDPLDIAVAPLDEVAELQKNNRLILFAADTFKYDDNVYLLPASVIDLTPLPGIGRKPSRGGRY